jgi:DNA-binding MarR family transcriptional regulator
MNPFMGQQFPDQPEPEAADKLLQALMPAEESLGLPLLLVLAAIAREPGLSVNDLADRLNAPQQSASRYIATLQGRYSVPGRDFGVTPLISIEISRSDPRKRALHLTPAGAAQLMRVLAALDLQPEVPNAQP